MAVENLRNDLKQICTDENFVLSKDEEDFVVVMIENLCNFIKEER